MIDQLTDTNSNSVDLVITNCEELSAHNIIYDHHVISFQLILSAKHILKVLLNLFFFDYPIADCSLNFVLNIDFSACEQFPDEESICMAYIIS